MFQKKMSRQSPVGQACLQRPSPNAQPSPAPTVGEAYGDRVLWQLGDLELVMWLLRDTWDG